MFVDRGHQTVLRQYPGNLEGSDRIHVGGDHRDASPLTAAVQEREIPFQVYLGTTLEVGAFRFDQHIFKTKLQVRFNTHVSLPGFSRQRLHCR